MPYIIRRPRVARRALVALAAGACVLLGGAGVAAAPAMAADLNPASCTTPALTQPFASFGDQNFYTLLGGESPDKFTGSGWTLSGGANLVSSTLYDGKTGTVLNLPSGSKAVSPEICVNTSMPVMRTMVQNVVGGEGVQFYISYLGTNTWTNPQNTGQVHGQQTSWSLSDPVNIQPPNVAGWSVAKFTFIPGGHSSDFRIYDFYVDPYSR